MSPPGMPIEIPPTAFTALASLRQTFGDALPAGTDFGIGMKQVAGEFQQQLALIVFVPEKLPPDSLPPGQVIPAIWTDPETGTQFVTDVVQSRPTPIGLINDSSFHAALVGGIEIGWSEPLGGGLVTVHNGTIGCIVQRRSDGQRQLLTANHVAALAVDVSQPAPGGPQSSVVGTVTNADVGWDCSAIDLNATRGAPLPIIQDLGAVMGSGTAQLWDGANKRGRTTGATTGVVVGIVLDAASAVRRIRLATFPFGGLYCWFGDSGSSVLNGNGEVIGLLLEMDEFQTDPNGTPVPTTSIGLAAPIQAVVDALDVEIGVSPPFVSAVQPDTAAGVLANGGTTQLDGLGFDAGSTVTFGGTPAISVVPASPRRLIVMPPPSLVLGSVDVIVTNSLGEGSFPSPTARFTY
jgi:hypothetical protein